MGQNESSGGGGGFSASAVVRADEPKAWSKRYAAYSNRSDGNFLLTDGKPLILKATLELTLVCNSAAASGAAASEADVVLQVRETGKDRAHAMLPLPLPPSLASANNKRGGGGSSSAITVATTATALDDSMITRAVRWRSLAFVLLTPPVSIDKELCARVLVWRDSKTGGAGGGASSAATTGHDVMRVRLLQPFAVTFSRSHAAIKLPLPGVSPTTITVSGASAALPPTPSAVSLATGGSGGSPAAGEVDRRPALLLTRKSATALYTTYQRNINAALSADAVSSAVPVSDEYSAEPEEVSLLNHQMARWGPYVLRELPQSASAIESAAAAAAAGIGSTVMPLIVDRPAHNASRALTTEFLAATFAQLFPAPTSSESDVDPNTSPVLFGAATPTAERLRSMIVAYTVVYPLCTVFKFGEPFVLYFDQIAVGASYPGVMARRARPVITIDVLNPGSRTSAAVAPNTEGTIRLRVAAIPAPATDAPARSAAADGTPVIVPAADVAAATKAVAYSSVAASASSPSATEFDGGDSGLASKPAPGFESIGVSPSMSLTNESLANWRPVSIAAVGEVTIAVSVPYYQSTSPHALAANSVETAVTTARLSAELYPYPYLRIVVNPNSSELKQSLAAAAADPDAQPPKPEVHAAVAAARAAPERELYVSGGDDHDDAFAGFRKKKNVNKKEAREIDLGFVKSFQSTEF